jgi:hypothetical protein
MALKPRPSPEDQVKTFRKAARELDCDDNEERFKDALRAIAKKKPQHRTTRKPSAAKR